MYLGVGRDLWGLERILENVFEVWKFDGGIGDCHRVSWGCADILGSKAKV